MDTPLTRASKMAQVRSALRIKGSFKYSKAPNVFDDDDDIEDELVFHEAYE